VRVRGLAPYDRDGVVVGRLDLDPSPEVRVGIMMVNGWFPWILIAAWKCWNVVWVAADLEPLGPLPVTVLKASYQHIKLSFVCDSGVTLILSDACLPGISSPRWEAPITVHMTIGLSPARRKFCVKGWHSQLLYWNHASCGG
jgi:hypothetical protein